MNKILYCCVVFYGCFIACGNKKENLVKPNLSPDIFTSLDLMTSVIKDSVEADGFKTNEVLVKVSPALLAKYKTVKFETTPNSNFSNGAVVYQTNLDIAGEAKSFVNSTTSGNVIVKATVGELTKQVTVYFGTSHPDRLSIESDSVFFTALPGSKMSITARLFKTNGQITAGQIVDFRDSTEDNRSVGIFLNNTLSTSTGIATSSYWIQDTSYHGYLYIVGTIAVKNGFISGRSRVKIR